MAHLIMRRRPLPAHAGGDGRDNAFAKIERSGSWSNFHAEIALQPLIPDVIAGGM